METYEVTLGIDRAAKDTKRRITMCVREGDPLSAAIAAEEEVDDGLSDPVEYSHAIRVKPVPENYPLAKAQPLPLAA